MLKSIFNKFFFNVFSNTFLNSFFNNLKISFNNLFFTKINLSPVFNKKAVYYKNFSKKNFYSKLASYAVFTKRYVRKSHSYLHEYLNSPMPRFKPSDLSLLYYKSFSNFISTRPIFYFLRKHKLFNKGRYSRNRQIYRTGMYWCLWVNILAVTGFYYWFYRFTMNFGYLWPFFSLFILSFFIPRAIKYNYFYISNLFSSLIKLLNWFYLIFCDFFSFFSNFVNSFFSLSKLNSFFSKNLNFSFLSFFQPILLLLSFFGLFLFDKKDLMLKKYSHWNYFLPISWIHKDHRSFFYKRLYYIFFC